MSDTTSTNVDHSTHSSATTDAKEIRRFDRADSITISVPIHFSRAPLQEQLAIRELEQCFHAIASNDQQALDQLDVDRFDRWFLLRSACWHNRVALATRMLEKFTAGRSGRSFIVEAKKIATERSHTDLVRIIGAIENSLSIADGAAPFAENPDVSITSICNMSFSRMFNALTRGNYGANTVENDRVQLAIEQVQHRLVELLMSVYREPWDHSAQNRRYGMEQLEFHLRIRSNTCGMRMSVETEFTDASPAGSVRYFIAHLIELWHYQTATHVSPALWFVLEGPRKLEEIVERVIEDSRQRCSTLPMIDGSGIAVLHNYTGGFCEPVHNGDTRCFYNLLSDLHRPKNAILFVSFRNVDWKNVHW